MSLFKKMKRKKSPRTFLGKIYEKSFILNQDAGVLFDVRTFAKFRARLQK